MRRRLPAYSRDLAQARRNGLVPDVGFILVALDWELGQQCDEALVRIVVPPDRLPGETDFGFLAGLSVIVAHRDTDLVRAADIAGELLGAYVDELVVMNVDLPQSDPDSWRQIQGPSC